MIFADLSKIHSMDKAHFLIDILKGFGFTARIYPVLYNIIRIQVIQRLILSINFWCKLTGYILQQASLMMKHPNTLQRKTFS